MSQISGATRRQADEVLVQLAEYAVRTPIASPEAYETARLCLMDSFACMMLALGFEACRRVLGPVVEGAVLARGCRVPGTAWELDPVTGAFNIGAMVRWLDYNDTFLAAEWGHPSDNLGAILAVADWLSRRGAGLRVQDLLTWMIKAHEIQGALALENAFNRVGLDHVLLVRVASTAVATAMLGGTREQVADALSQAWIDGGALRTYRHAPNTGSRKSWAAGDATSRGVRLALLTMRGEMGYATALTAKTWGFYDVLFKGQRFALSRPLGSYVMEHVLFKVSYPAEFHAQTAVEAAVRLHPQVVGRLEQVERVVIETQEPAVRIIDKTGPLNNPADRDHCIQYMTAVGLIKGNLAAEDYEAEAAADPRIDALRARMQVVENPRYSRDYLDPEKRSIANAVQVFFADGTSTERVEVEYPIGHRRRRAEAVPLLRAKFEAAVGEVFAGERRERILAAFAEPERLAAMAVDEFMSLWVSDADQERAGGDGGGDGAGRGGAGAGGH